jgi:DNA-binding CsgD family transcriptional regulator
MATARPWPASRFRIAQRTAVLDAGMALWAARARVLQSLADGTARDCHIGGVGDEINDWLFEESPSWRHLLSVRPTGTAAQLRRSLPNNRALVDAGLEMVSVFDYERLEEECRQLIVAEPLGQYLFAVAEVQMKVIDHERVLLDGPSVGGEPSVMVCRAPAVLEAAMRYWNAVLGSAFDCGQERAAEPRLTERQRLVVGLMQDGMTDEAMARQLEVSVRTVRSDVAAVLEALQVRSRFSAGFRLGRSGVSNPL